MVKRLLGLSSTVRSPVPAKASTYHVSKGSAGDGLAFSAAV